MLLLLLLLLLLLRWWRMLGMYQCGFTWLFLWGFACIT